MTLLNTLLVTGAAGRIGTDLRDGLGQIAKTLRLSDIKPIEDLRPNEEFVACDLSDREAMRSLVAGCDGIVHLGGIANEQHWDDIRDGNIEGMLNLYEAARAAGHPRIVYASSYHVIGYYPQSETIDTSAPLRPDSLYGVSKVFGEALASMYHDKLGQETAIVRIGSCFPTVHSHRMMKTWFSSADFLALITRAFTVETLGCPILFGASDNKDSWWINDQAEALGWAPRDSSEPHRAEVDATHTPPEAGSPDDLLQGGAFTTFAIKAGLPSRDT